MLKPTWLLEEEKKLTKKIIYLKFCIPYHYIYINIRVWNVQRWLYSDSTVIIGNFMDLFRVYSKIYSKEWLKEFWICSSFYLPSSSKFLLSENKKSWKFKKKLSFLTVPCFSISILSWICWHYFPVIWLVVLSYPIISLEIKSKQIQ